jgi:hypothetical protein
MTVHRSGSGASSSRLHPAQGAAATQQEQPAAQTPQASTTAAQATHTPGSQAAGQAEQEIQPLDQAQAQVPGPTAPAAAAQDPAPAQHRRAHWAGRAMTQGRWPVTLTTPLSSHTSQKPTPPRLPVAQPLAPDTTLAPQAAQQRARQRLEKHQAQVNGNKAAERAAERLHSVATRFGGEPPAGYLTATVESIINPRLAAPNRTSALAHNLFASVTTANNISSTLAGLQLGPAEDAPAPAGVAQTSEPAAKQLLLYTLSAQNSGDAAPAVLEAFLSSARAGDDAPHSLVTGPREPPAAVATASETQPLLAPQAAQAPPPATQVAAFDMACSLASTGPGLDVLHQLMPELRNDADDDHRALLRKEAARQVFHAAAPLQAALKRAGHPVASLEDLRQTCAQFLPQSLGGEAPLRPQADPRTGALRKETLAAKTLVAAMALLADPQADLAPPLKDAYFSFRNGFRHEGKGTPLDMTQKRLFKLTTYMQRAADNANNSRARTLWQGVKQSLGKNKSPLDALAWGTGGARLRTVQADFQKVTRGIAALRTSLQAQLNAQPGGDVAQGLQIRLAALNVYERRLNDKGWRDEVDLGRTGIRQVLREANAASRPVAGTQQTSAASTSAQAAEPATSPTARTGDPIAALANHAEAQSLRRTLITPRLLAQWAAQSDDATRQAVEGMDSLLNAGDPQAQPIGSPDDVYAQLRSVAKEAHPTFDVKHQGGGREGLNYRANLLNKLGPVVQWVTDHNAPLPAANMAARLTHARVALLDVGSSSHGGTLFVGSDRRLGLGAGGDLGLYGRDGVDFGGAALGLGFAFEGAHARGVMLRTRIVSKMEGEAPFERRAEDQDEAQVPLWRAKMLSAMDAIAKDGPGAGAWPTPQEMWSALAGQFCQDLDVSINPVNLSSKAWTRTAPVAGVNGLGGQSDSSPALSLPVVSYSSVSTWLTSRRSETGSFQVDTVAAQHNLSRVLAIGATGRLPDSAAPSVMTSGHVLADVAAGAPLLGASIPIQEHHVNVRLRLAQQDGRIESSMTFMDTEFGSVDDYRAYLQSREQLAQAAATPQTTAEQRLQDPAWSTSLPDGAAAPDDAAGAQAALLQHLGDQEGGADRSGQFFCERRRLRPDAARKVDELRALREAVMESSLPARTKAHEAKALDAAVTSLIESDSSWGNRFLFTMEQNGSLRAVGNSAVVQLETVQAVQHLHMTHAVRAAADPT